MATAILVHGMPATARLWDNLRTHLDPKRRVIALDLPGFDQPPPAGWTGTKEVYVDWLLEQIESVARHDGPVHLVGHDWGCLLTCRAASLRPELLRSLTFGNGPIDEHWPLHSLWSTWNIPGEGERWMDELDTSALGPMMIGAGMSKEAAERCTWKHDWNRTITLSLYRSATNVGREWGPDLANIVVPSLALWGQLDLIVPIEMGRRMATRMGAEVVGLNAHHFWPSEKAEEAAAVLERHWTRAESSDQTILTQQRPRV